VFKFVEHPENNENLLQQKCKVKFKILSLKVKGPMDYAPELVPFLLFLVSKFYGTFYGISIEFWSGYFFFQKKWYQFNPLSICGSGLVN
jgi:hypothetical protein